MADREGDGVVVVVVVCVCVCVKSKLTFPVLKKYADEALNEVELLYAC